MQYPKTSKVLEFERTHPNKRKQNGLPDDFTPAERREAQSWSWPTWLKGTGPEGDENAKLLNSGIFWFGCWLTHENLNTLCQVSELTKLFNVIKPPEAHVVTAEERTAAEAAMAQMDRSWRGEGRQAGPDSAPFAVCYNSVENLDRIVDYVNKDCFGVATGETFLVGFRTLLSKGELTPMKKEQRPLNAPFATPSSVRAAQDATILGREADRKSKAELIKLRDEFKADYKLVDNYHGQGLATGLRSHAAKYSGQKDGLAKLHAKYDGKFTNDDLKGYNKMMADLERDVEKLRPSGGAIKINDANDKPNEYRGGGSIATDVPTSPEAAAARAEHNRQLLSGNITNKKPVGPAN